MIRSAKFPSDSYGVVIRRVNSYMTISTLKVNLCKICVRLDKRYRSVTTNVRKILPTILDKINRKPRPPPLPPKSRMGKWSVFALRAASSLIWAGWGFAVPFYFVQDCSCVGVSIVILRAAAVVNKTNFVPVSFWDGPNSAYNCSFFFM